MAGLNEPIEPTKIWDKDGFEVPPKFFRPEGYFSGTLPPNEELRERVCRESGYFQNERAYQDPPGFREFIEAAREVLTPEAFESSVQGCVRDFDDILRCPCYSCQADGSVMFSTLGPEDITPEMRRKMEATLSSARPYVRPPSTDDLDDVTVTDHIRTHYRLQQSTIRPDDPIWTASGA